MRTKPLSLHHQALEAIVMQSQEMQIAAGTELTQALSKLQLAPGRSSSHKHMTRELGHSITWQQLVHLQSAMQREMAMRQMQRGVIHIFG
jgi:hypothetical protein